MNNVIPDYVTHYYLPDRKPFLSLSDLDENELHIVLEELREKARRGETKRSFADWYIPERKKTELQLREQFISKGGRPDRKYPIYFVLGKSETQKSMDPNQAELKMPLEIFSVDKISFTYPDSMASMILKDDLIYRKDYHGEVFMLAELIKVISIHSFPEDKAERTSKFLYPSYVEMQLWTDEPIKDYI